MVSRASFSEVVSRIAGVFRPCSAWPSRSVAQSSPSTVSSAMTRVSVGPAIRSIPTRPKSWRLASATKALPGPYNHGHGINALRTQCHGSDRLNTAHAVNLIRATEVHGGNHCRDSVHHDKEARTRSRVVRPRLSPSPRYVGGGGQQSIPAGNVAADRSRPACFCGRVMTPGRVSTSMSFIEDRCAWAKLRTCAWANLMSSMFRGESWDKHPSSPAPKGGTQEDSSCRTSPRFRAGPSPHDSRYLQECR